MKDEESKEYGFPDSSKIFVNDKGIDTSQFQENSVKAGNKSFISSKIKQNKKKSFDSSLRCKLEFNYKIKRKCSKDVKKSNL